MKHKRFFFLSVMFLIVFTNVSFGNADENRPEFKKYFDEYGYDGTFVLYDQNAKKFVRYNPRRAKKRFTPASTFKIANSLIGLETGELSGEDHVFRWDGKKRLLDIWDKDLNLNQAFNASCVPCYQELARNIGTQRMQKWINKLGYGNKTISGGIDMFWLTGNLRISANEEVEFLRRLYENKLPLEASTMAVVKKIMLREDLPEYKLSYKTGWNTDNSVNTVGSKSLGWIVGYLERDDNVYFFATNLGTSNTPAKFAASRLEITKKILKDLNLL